jgi:hypothetical protein
VVVVYTYMLLVMLECFPQLYDISSPPDRPCLLFRANLGAHLFDFDDLT